MSTVLKVGRTHLQDAVPMTLGQELGGHAACVARGAGPLFRPLEMTGRFYDDIVRPVHRLWFANDACDRLNRRWIEGAIASAVTTAYAINAGMRNALPQVAESGNA
jgi:hypothetical protein